MDADPLSAGAGPRSAAVLGHPVDHSLSPVLHGAAYRALGLDDWTYERIDCDADRLPSLVDSSPAHRIGYSVTMPGKFAALAHASEVSDRARIVGSANTLVRRSGGWYADCTDVDGVTGALAEFGDLPAAPTAVLLGVGGTARPVLAGLAAAGATRVVLASRRDNAGPAAECGRALGLDISTVLLTDASLPGEIEAADVLVNTVPEPGIRDLTDLVSRARRLFDVLYDPWPTVAGAAASAAGVPVVGGDVMLLNQAFGQVELFTGRPAPRAEMAAALARALGR
ncbi:shikimate dehydrogenase [Dietzia cinnamea]|uniref:Shikimate dehydrogenase n=1 Tax=Dietzia cinnamea TaxID=321318 RepID=A0AAW5Q596_9ACTN|nr:shikimate dehydrogenase [Dietzia cinnamea]MCT1711903.1 shikimate dehydrogenase [Dietzia cinnamea]MCT1862640.1 shikimate dehydrogenase [Dietzia cinnamea]MCT2028956.1 shikimate dehydrogenase [Dietzia cinnamea]MCT2032468.1 shikimate dehydrogenase [Dietzia cinnamea]MCT2057859.1 shikimate dehydrogenase [Dietzia cinnamea]